MVNAISGNGYDVTSIWQNLFNKIDTNGDGSIDKTEMESIVSKSGLSVEDIFSKLDTDQDGVIGKNDFEEALSKLRAQHPHGPPLRPAWERTLKRFSPRSTAMVMVRSLKLS